jgi:hypothetical protein
MNEIHSKFAIVTWECCGCGKKQQGSFGKNGDAFKPHSWFMRGDEDGVQVTCSRECIEKVAAASGKTPCVLPF